MSLLKFRMHIVLSIIMLVIFRITSGPENILFHYVQIEVGEGILLAPTNTSSSSIVIGHFRRTCLIIHKILQNTMR